MFKLNVIGFESGYAADDPRRGRRVARARRGRTHFKYLNHDAMTLKVSATEPGTALSGRRVPPT